jgi:hypothetical protein
MEKCVWHPNIVKYLDYLAEKVQIMVNENKALQETTNKLIEHNDYLAENLEKAVNYSEYLAENVDKGIAYSEYLGENLDKGIAYTEYVAEKLNNGIEYTEYIAENLNKNIPEAFINALFRPFITDSNSKLKYPAIIEILSVFSFIFISFYYRRTLSKEDPRVLHSASS